MKKIQKKLMFIIVLGIVLSTCISGLTSLVGFNSIGKERSNDILSRELELTSSHLNEICLDVEKIVDSLSEYYSDEFPGVMKLKEEAGTKYINNAKKLAKILVTHNEYICAVYYRFNPDILDSKAGFFLSKTASNSKLVETEPTDISQYDRDDLEYVAWFYEPLDAGKAIWVDQYMNLNNDILTLTYATPLYTEDGEFIGVVGVDIDMKKLYDQISKTRIYDTGFAAMLSKNGEVQYSPKKLYIGQDGISRITNSDKSENLSYYDKQKIMTVLSQKLRYGDYLLVIIANEDLYELEHRVTFSIVLITLSVSLCIIAVLTGLLYKLFYQFKTDTLTRTSNRSSYMEEIDDIDAEIRTGHNVNFSLVIFDINGLKRVNDDLGHMAGDELIKNTAELLCKHFVQGTIYRVGGDEFVFISRQNNQTFVRYIFEKFLKEMEEKVKNYDIKIGDVVVSAGMAVYDANEDTCYEDTFRRADQEMYQNKAEFYKVNKLLDRRK